MEHMVCLPDHTEVPALGQGTWYLGEDKRTFQQEREALIAGVGAGMTLIDTAEMYGSGKSEILIGNAIRDMKREDLFLVSKVYPQNAGRRHIFRSCMDSMKRLGTDHLDLYLLHWRGGIPLEETVACMEQLKKEGKIRRWGVSNFDTDDMEELWSVPNGKHCAVNQVLYHVGSRGIEYDLLPWMRDHGVALMAYSPLAQAGTHRRGLLNSPALQQIAAKHNCTVFQVMLAFAIRDGHTIAIPRSGKAEHTLLNAGADSVVLDAEDLAKIDQAFPAPTRKTYLDML